VRISEDQLARYLVIHIPIEEEETVVRPISDMTSLAVKHGLEGANPRWLKAWSPDLNDDRIFTLWDADSAASIQMVLEQYAFLNNMTAQPLRVQEWGPAEVLSAAERITNDT
jgi:hypothetical protein